MPGSKASDPTEAVARIGMSGTHASSEDLFQTITTVPAAEPPPEVAPEAPAPVHRPFSVAPVFPDMPERFTAALNAELHGRGLINAGDFLKPGSAEVVRTALMSALKADALNIVAYAKEHVKS